MKKPNKGPKFNRKWSKMGIKCLNLEKKLPAAPEFGLFFMNRPSQALALDPRLIQSEKIL